jgi:hypothetical protein
LNVLLHENDYFKDFVIVYAGVQFKAHKNVLASTSLYFQKMLTNEWKEKETCAIDMISSVIAADFKAFLDFLYLGPSNLLEVFIFGVLWSFVTTSTFCLPSETQ